MSINKSDHIDLRLPRDGDSCPTNTDQAGRHSQIQFDNHSSKQGASSARSAPGFQHHEMPKMEERDKVQEQMAHQKSLRLQDYDLLKRRFDQGGVTLRQSQLLKSFGRKLIKIYKPLASVSPAQTSLIMNIALCSQLLLMREFEVIFWAALNRAEDIEAIVKENETEANPETVTIQAIRSRLMMTAFYAKQKLSDERTEAAIQAFFSHHFDYFIGKHTDWLLLNEPDTSKLTPMALNGTKLELSKLFQKELAKTYASKKDTNIFQQDLNQVVALLSEEGPDGAGKAKHGRKKRGSMRETRHAELEQKLAPLLGKREKPDDDHLEQQQRELEEHHDDISRQISRLSDIRYQPSDIHYPYAGQVLNSDPQNVSHNALNTKKMTPGDYSKIYQIRPHGNDNPHLSRFLMNPLESQDKHPSNQATPTKLMLSASPINPVGNLSSYNNNHQMRKLNLSSLFVRQETQHLQRVCSGIEDMSQLMQQANMNDGQGNTGKEGNTSVTNGALGQFDKDKVADILGGNISMNIRKNIAPYQIPKDFGDSNFSLKNIQQFQTQKQNAGQASNGGQHSLRNMTIFPQPSLNKNDSTSRFQNQNSSIANMIFSSYPSYQHQDSVTGMQHPLPGLKQRDSMKSMSQNQQGANLPTHEPQGSIFANSNLLESRHFHPQPSKQFLFASNAASTQDNHPTNVPAFDKGAAENSITRFINPAQKPEPENNKFMQDFFKFNK